MFGFCLLWRFGIVVNFVFAVGSGGVNTFIFAAAAAGGVVIVVAVVIGSVGVNDVVFAAGF